MPEEAKVEGTWEQPVIPEGVVSKEPAGTQATDTEKSAAPVEPSGASADAPDLDALLKEEEKSALTTLESLGITNENAAALLEKAKNFDATVSMLQNNPDLFLNELEKMDSKSLEKLLDKATDRFIERHGGDKNSEDRAAGEKNPELAEVRQKLAALEKERETERNEKQAQANAQVAQEIQNKLDAKVQAIFDKIPQLDEADQKGVRSRIMDSLGNDKVAVAQIVSGNLTLVAKHAKTILEDHFKGRAASVEKRKAAQQKVADNAPAERTAAAAATAGESKVPDWESAIQGVASALNKGRK